MAARKKTTRRKTTRTRPRRPSAALARIEPDLPPSLRDYSRQVRRGLTQLEGQVERAESRTRRQITRLVREASHTLGRLEAQGERRWRKLSGQARREVLRQLRRLEKAIEGPRKKKATRRKPAPVAAAQT